MQFYEFQVVMVSDKTVRFFFYGETSEQVWNRLESQGYNLADIRSATLIAEQ